MIPVLLVLTGLGFATSGLTDSHRDGDQAAVTVGMTNTLKFTPDTVRIKRGESVRWKNNSLLVHSVTADRAEATVDGIVEIPQGAEPFDSGLMDPKEEFQHTFTIAGTYKYFCIPHEGAKMYGWVIVE